MVGKPGANQIGGVQAKRSLLRQEVTPQQRDKAGGYHQEEVGKENTPKDKNK